VKITFFNFKEAPPLLLIDFFSTIPILPGALKRDGRLYAGTIEAASEAFKSLF